MVRDTRLWYINLDSPLVLITPHNRCIMQPTTDGLWWQYWGGLSVVSSSSQYSQGINTPPNHYQNDYKATNPNQKDSLSSNLASVIMKLFTVLLLSLVGFSAAMPGPDSGLEKVLSVSAYDIGPYHWRYLALHWWTWSMPHGLWLLQQWLSVARWRAV